MSNGDSPDGFVFPPFIPAASARPAPTPPPPPPAPEPASADAGRMTMPWDLETPIVREADDAPAAPAEDEDLPWLEVPDARTDEASAAEAPPAPQDDALPDWMTWDERDGESAAAEARDTVAPVAGLEEFVTLDDLHADVPPPTVTWTDAEPPAGDSSDSVNSIDFLDSADSVNPVDSMDSVDSMSSVDSVEAGAEEPFPEMVFDDAPASADAPSSDDWSLAAPEAAEPPPVDAEPLPTWEESPAAAEPSYEISVDGADDGVIQVEAAAPAPDPFVADEEAVIAAEPAPAAEAAVIADAYADATQPDDAGEIAAEPDPFTAAAVAEAEAIAPPIAAASPFADVADRLEGIARMLRERPDELMAGGSSDPLALLVTGYVMGYTARGR